MVRKHNVPSRQQLLESKLSELAALIMDVSPQSRVEISYEQYEDEDAHVYVYPPAVMDAEEVERLELSVAERCNDILLETGVFIISAVCG